MRCEYTVHVLAAKPGYFVLLLGDILLTVLFVPIYAVVELIAVRVFMSCDQLYDIELYCLHSAFLPAASTAFFSRVYNGCRMYQQHYLSMYCLSDCVLEAYAEPLW